MVSIALAILGLGERRGRGSRNRLNPVSIALAILGLGEPHEHLDKARAVIDVSIALAILGLGEPNEQRIGPANIPVSIALAILGLGEPLRTASTGLAFEMFQSRWRFWVWVSRGGPEVDAGIGWFQSRWRFWVWVSGSQRHPSASSASFQSRWRFWVWVSTVSIGGCDDRHAVSIALAILGLGEPSHTADTRDPPGVSIALAILGLGEPSRPPLRKLS